MEKQKDFHNLRYMKVCPICKETFITDIQHRQACKPCLEKSNPDAVRHMLETLEILGWSELIDSRWKDKVIQQLKDYYGKDIPMVDIYKLLEIVLW